MHAAHAHDGVAFHAQTCIDPDRIALLARDVSTDTKSSPRTFIQFERAAPGQLRFSVRGQLACTNLMTFNVHITRRSDGFTGVEIRTLADLSGRSAARDAYRHYVRRLGSALTRFDPLSTVVLVETDP